MKTDRCLVIIDLQERFGVENDCDVVKTVVKRVNRAKHNDDHIILLEYFGNGKTVSDILDCLPSYVNPLVKHHNTGHNEILEYLDEQDLSFKVFTLMGINLPWCVGETAAELNYYFYHSRIELDYHACDDFSHSGSRPKERSLDIFLSSYVDAPGVDIVYV